jgi:anti-anti-sigma factor
VNGPPQTLAIETQRESGATVVALRGSAGPGCARQLRPALTDLLQQGCQQIVLDLADLQSIGSEGLGSLVAAQLRARNCGSTIKLLNPNAQIRQLLEQAGLTQLFAIYANLREAISA